MLAIAVRNNESNIWPAGSRAGCIWLLRLPSIMSVSVFYGAFEGAVASNCIWYSLLVSLIGTSLFLAFVLHRSLTYYTVPFRLPSGSILQRESLVVS